MFDPIQAPESIPLQSVKNLLAVVKGGEKISKTTVLSGLTLVAYATKFLPIPEDGAPKGFTGPVTPEQFTNLLETLISEEEGAKGAIIPWELIVAFIIKQLLNNLL